MEGTRPVEPAAARFYRHRVGEVELIALSDGGLNRVESTYGHTPGHVMVSTSAGGQTVYNISDVVVDPLFVEYPEWASAIDMDAGRADKARRQFFAEAAGENALVFAHHPGPVSESWSNRACGRLVALATDQEYSVDRKEWTRVRIHHCLEQRGRWL
jgi:glyoxylase-like metal-dependent hydrolase (beta-lactamase superfamily II)